jgi:hypothetical protein
MMIEVCAGLLDEDNPEQCIIKWRRRNRISHYKKWKR